MCPEQAIVGLVGGKLIDAAGKKRAEVVRIPVGQIADCNKLSRASAYASLLAYGLLVSYELEYRSGTRLTRSFRLPHPLRTSVSVRVSQDSIPADRPPINIKLTDWNFLTTSLGRGR